MNTTMMHPPLFSIITPVYNAAEKLEATLTSVLAQPSELYEYIIVDGGSTDGTTDVLRRLPVEIQWLSEPDHGIYDAMNKGIRRAQGKYLYFLGAGDCLRPGALAAMADIVPREETALVYGNVYWVELGRVHDGPWTAVKFTRGCICHQAIFYAREIFSLLGGYDIQYPIGADYILNMKAFGDSRIRKIYTPTVIADYEGGGISTTANDPAFFRDAPGVIRRHLGLVPYLFCRTEMLLPEAVKQRRFQSVRAVRRLLAGRGKRG